MNDANSMITDIEKRATASAFKKIKDYLTKNEDFEKLRMLKNIEKGDSA